MGLVFVSQLNSASERLSCTIKTKLGFKIRDLRIAIDLGKTKCQIEQNCNSTSVQDSSTDINPDRLNYYSSLYVYFNLDFYLDHYKFL